VILVTGATGNVGKALVGLLAGAGSEVRATSRRPTRFPEGVDVVSADLGQPSTLDRACEGVARIFLMGPISDLARYAENVCRCATRAGADHVVLLSSLIVELGADDELSCAHRAAERAVIGSGLAWTVLRPGEFMSNALAWAGAIRDGRRIRRFTGDFPAAPIDPDDIAAVAGVVLGADAHIGMEYPLTGPERITPRQQVETLADLLGRSLLFEDVSEDEALAEFMKTRDRTRAVSLLSSLRRPDVPWAEPRPTVEQITGRKPSTFQCWAGRRLAAFR
jgi:(4-alkanoyl-5-oxo-2,5-dihydrofuran-3-yl)methyl phosphate reductase